MPIRDFACDSCGLAQERFYTSTNLPLCEVPIGPAPCGGTLTMMPRSDEGSRRVQSKLGTFPFTTPHINGKPMVIESMGHLRRVERDYGVVLTAFSQGERNLDPIKNPPTYRGNRDR